MTKLAPEWVRTSDPVIRSPARYRWTTAPAGWARVRNVYQCCNFAVIFWGGTLGEGGGGGTPDIIHAYVRWGATGPQNAWGILRVK